MSHIDTYTHWQALCKNIFLKSFTLKFVNPPKRRIQKSSRIQYFLFNFNQFPQNWIDLIYCSFLKVNIQYRKAFHSIYSIKWDLHWTHFVKCVWTWIICSNTCTFKSLNIIIKIIIIKPRRNDLQISESLAWGL